MRRREFLGLPLACTILPVPSNAQSRRKVVGALLTASPQSSERYVSALRRGLKELGYSSDPDFEFIPLYADGNPQRFPSLIAELLALSPSVIVTGTSSAILSVRAAAPQTPIVGAALADTVVERVAATLSHPGGSVTGIVAQLDTLVGKKIEIGREIVPSVTRVALLLNGSSPLVASFLAHARQTMAALGGSVIPVEVRGADEIYQALKRAADDAPDLIIVPEDAMLLSYAESVAATTISFETADCVWLSGASASRWPSQLRHRSVCELAPSRHLCRQNPQRLATGRVTYRASDKVRDFCESPNRQGPWPDDPTDAPRPRR